VSVRPDLAGLAQLAPVVDCRLALAEDYRQVRVGDVPQDPGTDCRLGQAEGFQLDLAVDFLLGLAEVAQPDRARVYPLDPEVGCQRDPGVVVQLAQVKTLTLGTALTQIAKRQVLSWSNTRAMATPSPLP
jgi:hypothetical protein